MSALEQVFRWLHIFAGVMWIGLLYFFNFINGHFAAALDAETKKKVIPELVPRVLFWFRWGAAWTWITGVLLLMLVFYHGATVLDDPDAGFTTGTWVMILVTFLAVFLYDFLFKAVKGKPAIAIAFVAIAVIIYVMATWGGFSYRGYNIHIAAMFGTMMAFNVWFRIWPAQQKIIPAIKNGEKPDGDLAALAGMRSKHNTYMSVPLFWGMINAHTVTFSGGQYGIPDNMGYLPMLLITLLGWHIVWHCYRISGRVKGM